MATTCAAASLPATVPTWSSLASIPIGAIAAFLGSFGGVIIALRVDRQSKSEDNESRDLPRAISGTITSRADSSTQPTPEACPESEPSSSNSGEATNDISDAGGLPAAFVCCITSELFLNPVVASDGHSYERAAIEKWFERHDTSPRTGERLVSKDIIPNHNLRSQVLEYRRAEGLPDPPPWVPPEPTEAPAPTAAAPAEPAPAAAPSPSSPAGTASGPAGAAATPRQFRINIPQAEATALLASIRQVLDRSPALQAELGLAQAGAPSSPSENEQAAARILADPRLLSLVARHAAGTSGLEPLAPRLTRAAHTISQLLATEMQARRVAQNQAPGSQPIRPAPPAFVAAAGAAATSASTAGGGNGGGSGIGLAPPDDPPLFRAARAGDCGAVQRELLALQRTQPHLFASPTPRPPSGNNSSTTPQHWATADRPRDRLGESVLGIACQHGHLDLVRMLTSPAFGANPALPSLRDGTTPLHHAARTANAGVLQCLLDALQAPPREGNTDTSANALASALKARNHAGETPLHVAAGGRIGGFGLGNPSNSNNSPVEDASAAAAACAALLAAGADVSAVTEIGCTALHLAALVPGRSGVAELLLREGALPEAQEFVKHSTPVHHAAQSGDPLMLHAILGHVHRDAAKIAREGRASSGGGDNDDEDAVEGAGRAAACALANQAGKRGLVPLHCAAASGSALAVRALVSDYGARLDARGELDGASPLTVWQCLWSTPHFFNSLRARLASFFFLFFFS